MFWQIFNTTWIKNKMSTLLGEVGNAFIGGKKYHVDWQLCQCFCCSLDALFVETLTPKHRAVTACHYTSMMAFSSSPSLMSSTLFIEPFIFIYSLHNIYLSSPSFVWPQFPQHFQNKLQLATRKKFGGVVQKDNSSSCMSVFRCCLKKTRLL
jgi:hypothetical protein